VQPFGEIDLDATSSQAPDSMSENGQRAAACWP
jgi:hypothetical protein